MAFKKDSGRKLNFKRRTFEDTKKRSEQWGNLRDSYLKDHVPMWKPSDGENVIRILPPTWEDANHYGLDIFVHYGVGPDNSAFLDLKRMKGEPDPITEACDAAIADGDEEYAKELRSTKRVLVYLIDRDKPKDGIQMYAMPWTMDKDLATQSIDPRTHEFLYIDDPDEGYDVYISREGSGQRTKYTVRIARNPSAIDLTDDMIDLLEQNPLPECLVFHDYDHIAATFSGKKARKPEQDEEEQEAKPARKPLGQKATHKPEPEPEPEVELPTYDEVQQMDEDGLFELIESLDLEVDTAEMDSVEELQAAVVEALGLEKPKPKVGARKTFGKPKEPEPEAEETTESEESEEEDSVRSKMQSKLAGLRNRNK